MDQPIQWKNSFGNGREINGYRHMFVFTIDKPTRNQKVIFLGRTNQGDKPGGHNSVFVQLCVGGL